MDLQTKKKKLDGRRSLAAIGTVVKAVLVVRVLGRVGFERWARWLVVGTRDERSIAGLMR